MAREPDITLEEHARISAEVAEGGESEADVLKRYGVTSQEWTEATGRILSALAEDAQRNGADGQLAIRYSDCFASHQQSLRPPLSMTPEQWAELQFDIDRSGSTEEPLARRRMSMADYIRLVRVYAKRIVEEPEVAVRVERRQAELDATSA